MITCKKCQGAGGILWVTSVGTDTQWEHCDECGGTGEIEGKEDGKNK